MSAGLAVVLVVLTVNLEGLVMLGVQTTVNSLWSISPCTWVTNVINYYYLEEFEIYCWNVLCATCSCY